MIEHPQILFGAVMLSVVALVAWLFWMLPLWSRPGIFFAVTVVPDFRKSAEAQRLLRNYRIQTLLHVAISFALILAGALLQHFIFPIVGVLWLTVGPLVAISHAHKQALPHAVAVSTIREASLSPRTTQLPGGWSLELGPFVILLVTAIYLHLHWSAIPDRFPVHWGIDGTPNGWSARTPVGVYGPLVLRRSSRRGPFPARLRNFAHGQADSRDRRHSSRFRASHGDISWWAWNSSSPPFFRWWGYCRSREIQASCRL